MRTIMDPWDRMRKLALLFSLNRTNLPSTPQTLWFDWPLSGAARSDCDAVLMTSELAPHKTRQTRTATLPGGYHSSQWSYHVSTCFYMFLLCVWHSTKIKRDPDVACDGPGWHLVNFFSDCWVTAPVRVISKAVRKARAWKGEKTLASVTRFSHVTCHVTSLSMDSIDPNHLRSDINYSPFASLCFNPDSWGIV